MPQLPLDFTVSPTGGAAAANPDVANYQLQQVAAAQRQREEAHRASMQQMQEQAAQQQAQVAPLELQQHQQAVDQGQHRQLAETMMGDVAASATHPALIGKDFATLAREQPDYVRSFYDRYGPAISELPQGWNQTQKAVTGDPSIGGGQSKELSATRMALTKAGVSGAEAMDLPTATEALAQRMQDKAAQNVPKPIQEELVRLGKWKNGMTVEDAEKARDDAYLENGQIPEKYQKQAQTLISQIQRNPVLLPFAKQKEAYDTMKAGFDKPEDGGFSDMAMIEGFQRIVNPGATVRQATMANMKTAAGWLQQLDPSFQWGKATVGESLSPAARKRLMDLADKAFGNSKRAAASELAGKRNLARMLGIPNPDVFVNNILNYASGEGEQQPSSPAQGPDPKALEWLKANPNDPRAPGIREALGIK